MGGEVGNLLGVRVIESRNVPWDAMYATPDALLVGEFGHLRHVLALGELLRGMRDDSRRLLDEAWHRILGTDRAVGRDNK